MFRFFRQLPEALYQLTQALLRISEILPEILENVRVYEPLETRLAELERGRSQWEATVEAELLRSDSKYKASRAAEERTRTMAANAAALSSSDEGEESISEADQEYLELLRRNAEGVGDEGLHQLPAPMAVDAKTRALQAKFAAVI